MKHLKTILTLLLAVLLCISSLTACNNKPNESETTGGTQQTGGNVTQGTDDGTGTGEGEEEYNVEKEMYRPEQINWGDKDGPYEYVIACSESAATDTIKRDQFLFYTAELEGDAINTAIADRNAFMEEYFNIAIEREVNATETTVSTQTPSGRKYADLITLATTAYSTVVKRGYFLDVNTVDELNLDASYWNDRIQEEFTVNGRLFAIDGDLTSFDEMRTMSVLYNATLYENYSYKTKYGSVYKLVEDRKWTFDTMLEMYQGTSKSTTGSEYPSTATDTWGMLSEMIAPYYMFLGSGMKTVQNVDGQLQLVFANNYAAVYDVIEDIMLRFSKDPEVLHQNIGHPALPNSNTCWNDGEDMFRADLALFKSGTVGDATAFRDMKSEFGLLPIPLYTEGQENYYCYAIGTPFYIPITVKTNRMEMKSCSITEAFCYFSRYMDGELSIYDAFFENMSYVKLCRTEEDRQMLILLINSKTYDIDAACDITGVYTQMNNMVKTGDNLTNLSSTLSALRDAAYTALHDYITTLEGNYKD